MNLDEIVRNVVLPIVPVCEPEGYNGEEREYCTFSYRERGAVFGDDTADAVICGLMLHWYLPLGVNPDAKKRRFKAALEEAGFTYPTVENASDKDGQHYVFECEREWEA